MDLIITISEENYKIMEHVVPDVKQWLDDALTARTENCKAQMINDGISALRKDPAVTTMPANDDGILSTYSARSDYKNRKQRDVEAKEKLAARIAAEAANQ